MTTYFNPRSLSILLAILALLVGVTTTSAAPGRQVTVSTPLLAKDAGTTTYRSLVFDSSVFRQLQSASDVTITGFPLLGDDQVDLRLRRFYVTSPTAKLFVGADSFSVWSPKLDIVLLRGEVAGRPGSYAYLAISPLLSKGYITVDSQTLAVGSVLGGDLKGQIIMSSAAVDHADPQLSCPEMEVTEVERQPLPAITAGAAAAAGMKIADVAIDTDTSFVWLFREAQDPWYTAAHYAIALLGAASAIYERDVQCKLVLSFLRVWPIPNPNLYEPYPYSSNTNLVEFRNYWSANMGHVNRTLAVLLEGDSAFCGGQGIVKGLCDNSDGYCSFGMEACWPQAVDIPGIGTSWSTIADVWIFGHETGHVFGAYHSHCYSGMDSCASEGSYGTRCYHINSTIRASMGCIMSYCYTHPRPDGGPGYDWLTMDYPGAVGTDMRAHVAEVSCMRTGLDPVYVDRSNGGTQDGTAAHPFQTLQAAIEKVLPGGTIYVAPGDYPEIFDMLYPCAIMPTGAPGTVTFGY